MTENCILLIQERDPQVDMNQLVHQLEELHPIAFRLAFGLTHEEAAEELGLEPQTMRSYLKKNPSKRVKKLSATIAKRWLVEGRQLANVQHLILWV
jgi:predicted transcriptional regulator